MPLMTSRADLKGRNFAVAGHDPVNGGAVLICWLLGRGASVTVIGARDTPETGSLARRIDEQLKRSAPDGRSYADMQSRLSWTAKRRTDVADALALFASAWPRRIVGITGAQGKTTAALWTAHLIGDAVVAGHTPERPYVSALASRAATAVVELNRPGTLGGRRSVTLSTDDARQYHTEQAFIRRIDAGEFAMRWGRHNVDNLVTAMHAARLTGVPVASIVQRIASLPQVPYRQEIVYRDPKLVVVNDTTATSPIAGIAALARWGGPTTILIAGGSGGVQDYRSWAHEVTESVRRTNVVFLSGDATQKMRAALRRDSYGIRAFETLEGAWHAALERAATYVSSTVLFSPATDAGGLFEDELDRGRQFNALVRVLRPGRSA